VPIAAQQRLANADSMRHLSQYAIRRILEA
jgi:hypothetical protein